MQNKINTFKLELDLLIILPRLFKLTHSILNMFTQSLIAVHGGEGFRDLALHIHVIFCLLIGSILGTAAAGPSPVAWSSAVCVQCDRVCVTIIM